jgi:hypothetical protein
MVTTFLTQPTTQNISTSAPEIKKRPTSLSILMENARKLTSSAVSPDIPHTEDIPAVPISINKEEESSIKTELQTPEKESNKEVPDSTSLTEMAGRQFVGNFLGEIHDLINAGQQLDILLKEKAEKDNLTDIEKARITELRLDGSNIKEALKMFLEADENTRNQEQLQKVILAYNEYLLTFENEAGKVFNVQETSAQLLMSGIKEKQKEVKENMDKIGGDRFFQIIKKGIKSFETVAQKFINSDQTPEIYKKSVVNKTLEFVSSDLEGAKMLVRTNDITGIIMHLFGQQK